MTPFRLAPRASRAPGRRGRGTPSRASRPRLVRVASPGAQSTGQSAPVRNARKTRSTSSTLRPTSCSVTLMCNSTPFGSMMNVPRCVAPSSSSTPKERLRSLERVGDHRIADVGETRIRLEPCLVAEAAVRARREQHRVLSQEVGVALREGRELGRTDEREVAGVEEQDDPAAAVTRELEDDRCGLTAEVRLQGVIGNGLADSERHGYHLHPAVGGMPNRCAAGPEVRPGHPRTGTDPCWS